MNTPPPTWSRAKDGTYRLTEYAPKKRWERKRAARVYLIDEATMILIGERMTTRLLEGLNGDSEEPAG